MKRNLSRLGLLVVAWAWSSFGRAAEPVAEPAEAPWKVHQTVQALYPRQLLPEGITRGEARVRVSIDAEGRLTDALLTLATHREFGEEALRVVKRWRFEAARVKGEPMGVTGDLSFTFGVDGTVAVNKFWPASKEEEQALLDPSIYRYRAEGVKGLDHLPIPTHVEQPVYAKKWSERGLTGTATVDFYIDEAGKVRVPVVTDASDPLLAGSALAAIGQWTFEPPQRKGQPVLTHAEQVFNFQPVKK